MPEEQKNATIKSLEKGITRLTDLVVRMCHEKGCDNLPGLYGFKPYSVTANDMTKYKKERP